jgi:multidrug efflux pump subunit AcrB
MSFVFLETTKLKMVENEGAKATKSMCFNFSRIAAKHKWIVIVICVSLFVFFCFIFMFLIYSFFRRRILFKNKFNLNQNASLNTHKYYIDDQQYYVVLLGKHQVL